MTAKSPAYLESWSHELRSRAYRVRQLIGDVHWLSDGHHREAILREFLQRYVPAQLHISRGFVRAVLSDQCSPEIDILIADPTTHQPFFNEGGLLIAPPSSVVAHVEVKKDFNKAELRDALAKTSSTQLILARSADMAKVWRGICFFNVAASRTAESALDTIAEVVQEAFKESLGLGQEYPGVRPTKVHDVLPTCIATLDSFVVYVRFTDTANEIVLDLFESGNLSFACALADLFGAIRFRIGGAGVAEMDDLVEALPAAKRHSKKVTVNDG